MASPATTTRPPATASPNREELARAEHPYAEACLKFPKSYYDYERFSIEWGSPDPYLLSRKIGRGKYSEVFTAVNRILNRPCVVKMLKPVKEKRLAREVLILQHLCGVPNVICMYDMVKEEETGTPALVFEAVNNVDYRQLYPTFTDVDLRFYMYELVRTLDLVHAVGIFHRDVKPQNICIDPRHRKLRLIDWGLAEFYLPGQQYNVRVASRYYKPPELLVGFRYYGYTLDLWSVGCIIAAIIFKKEPFFHGQDNEDMLEQIAKVVGSKAIVEYVDSLGLPATNIPDTHRSRPYPRVPLASMTNSHTPLASPDAVDIVEKLFIVDHRKRPTAREALSHPFFNPVRHLFPPPGEFEQTQLGRPASAAAGR